MAIRLYRRHRKDCEAGLPEDAKTGEFEEGRRGWKKCSCLIHASGTIGNRFNRQSTRCWRWEDAKTFLARLEGAGSWTGSPAAPTPEPSNTGTNTPITIEAAVKAFAAEYEQTAAINTQKKYRLLLGKLKAFAAQRGFVALDQWKPIDVRDFRSSWKISPRSAAKDMSTIKTFFEFCVANEWIARNPARLVKLQRTREAADKRNEQKLPFSEDELKTMYRACAAEYGKQTITWSRSHHRKRAEAQVNRYQRKWTGQDLADFISVSVYTGLRISDVATFHLDRLQSTGEIRIRTTKAGTHVYTWVPEWLQQRIQERAQRVGPYIFGEHTTKDLNVITDVWRRKLKKLWNLCGKWTAKPTPHRFRHTFARILLQRPGVTVRDVAELLGNSEQVVRKHYAAWIPERQARLTGILKQAFAERPEPDGSQP